MGERWGKVGEREGGQGRKEGEQEGGQREGRVVEERIAQEQ